MRFRFTIRDLLFLVAIIALAVGWFIDHQRISRLAAQDWEYKTYKTSEIHSITSGNEIDKFGAEGWEAVGISTAGGGRDPMQTIVLLKRPKR